MFGIDLQDQRAIVTGSSSGIGRGIAVALATAGADVAVHYTRHEKEAEETATLIQKAGRTAVVVRADFLNPAEIDGGMKKAVAGLGGSVDILVNNVGDLVKRVPFEEYDTDLWNEVIALNLSSMFHVIRAVLPSFSAGARIINISSMSAVSGTGKHAFAYSAAKGGVISFTRGLATELAPRSIRVNCIAPGVVTTPFHDRFNTPEALEQVRKSLLLHQLGTPEDIAGVALFLASPLSAYMTGQTLEPNGGARMT